MVKWDITNKENRMQLYENPTKQHMMDGRIFTVGDRVKASARCGSVVIGRITRIRVATKEASRIESLHLAPPTFYVSCDEGTNEWVARDALALGFPGGCLEHVQPKKTEWRTS